MSGFWARLTVKTKAERSGALAPDSSKSFLTQCESGELHLGSLWHCVISLRSTLVSFLVQCDIVEINLSFFLVQCDIVEINLGFFLAQCVSSDLNLGFILVQCENGESNLGFFLLL